MIRMIEIDKRPYLEAKRGLVAKMAAKGKGRDNGKGKPK